MTNPQFVQGTGGPLINHPLQYQPPSNSFLGSWR